MATANVSRKSNTGKSSKAATVQVNLVELQAAVYAAVGKLSGESYERDELTDGGHYDVKLSIMAEVAGQRFSRQVDCTVDVGHASTRASSTGPGDANVVAWLLAKYNAATRETVLRELADACRQNGGKLPVSEADEEAAEKSLKALRQTIDQKVRGSVRVNCNEQPQLGVTG